MEKIKLKFYSDPGHGWAAVKRKFLEDLHAKTERRFREENAELAAFAGRTLQPWDIAYWAEKQRAALYDFDEEALRPYFPVESVVRKTQAPALGHQGILRFRLNPRPINFPFRTVGVYITLHELPA